MTTPEDLLKEIRDLQQRKKELNRKLRDLREAHLLNYSSSANLQTSFRALIEAFVKSNRKEFTSSDIAEALKSKGLTVKPGTISGTLAKLRHAGMVVHVEPRDGRVFYRSSSDEEARAT